MSVCYVVSLDRRRQGPGPPELELPVRVLSRLHGNQRFGQNSFCQKYVFSFDTRLEPVVFLSVCLSSSLKNLKWHLILQNEIISIYFYF